MTPLNPAHVSTGPSPLSEHALSHVMSDLLDNFAPTDEEEARIAMREAGYRASEIAQAMEAWDQYWERNPLCSTCGQPATHLWGSMDQDRTVHSMAGENKLTPSCDDCAGGDGFTAVIRAPLSFGTDLTPISPKSPELDQLTGMLDAFDDNQVDADRPFRTMRLDLGEETLPPLTRVKRALDYIANLKEVPFRAVHR